MTNEHTRKHENPCLTWDSNPKPLAAQLNAILTSTVKIFDNFNVILAKHKHSTIKVNFWATHLKQNQFCLYINMYKYLDLSGPHYKWSRNHCLLVVKTE